MVLQRAPVRARIWGYGFNVGDTVTVSISGGGEYQTITTEGMEIKHRKDRITITVITNLLIFSIQNTVAVMASMIMHHPS